MEKRASKITLETKITEKYSIRQLFLIGIFFVITERKIIMPISYQDFKQIDRKMRIRDFIKELETLIAGAAAAILMIGLAVGFYKL